MHSPGGRTAVRPNDSETEFLFVPADQVAAVAGRENAIPHDVAGAELGQHGAEYSFDAILEKFGNTDPALLELAKIVRGADTADKELTPY